MEGGELEVSVKHGECMCHAAFLARFRFGTPALGSEAAMGPCGLEVFFGHVK